jgi:hypothetical protein
VHGCLLGCAEGHLQLFKLEHLLRAINGATGRNEVVGSKLSSILDDLVTKILADQVQVALKAGLRVTLLQL